MIELRDNGPLAGAIREAANRSEARSVYLPLLRGITPDALAAFDPVAQTLVTGQRDATTVPTQALFLLNSAFVRKQSLALAERLLGERGLSDAARIQRAHTVVLGRTPSPVEIERARKFLADYEKLYQPPPAATSSPEPAPPSAAPLDADDMDRTEYIARELVVEAGGARTAAWMNLVQALYASAESRFVR